MHSFGNVMLELFYGDKCPKTCAEMEYLIANSVHTGRRRPNDLCDRINFLVPFLEKHENRKLFRESIVLNDNTTRPFPREAEMNPYLILGIESNSGRIRILRTFQLLNKKYGPGTASFKNGINGKEIFRQIERAYKILWEDVVIEEDREPGTWTSPSTNPKYWNFFATYNTNKNNNNNNNTYFNPRQMNNYNILNLQPGSSKKEIKVAYRSLHSSFILIKIKTLVLKKYSRG